METKQLLKDNGFINGRMLSFSKSEYRDSNPNSVCYFNANIFTLQEGKIWFGDLDLTKDADALKKVAKESNRTIFVLKEIDGRFENEDLLDATKIKNASIWDTTQETPFK